MCLASRALFVIVMTGAVPSAAWAQAPAIPDSPPGATTATPPAGDAPVPPPPSSDPPPAPVPAFTPPPGQSFTPSQPNTSAPGSPQPYAVPAYQAPPPVPAYTWNDGSPPPPPAPAEKPPRDVRIASAHVDRVGFLPTAETHPSGTWYLSDYDIIVPQVGVAVSDRTQITLVLTGDPFARDPLGLADFSVKSVLARGYRYRLAATGSVSGLIGFEQGFGFVGRTGFVAMLCFDDTCRSSANVSTNIGLAGAIVMLNGVGVVLRVSELVSFLFEGATLIGAGPGGVEEAHGVGGDVGLRLARERWGLDFVAGGFARQGERSVPLPLIAFTYRFLP